MRTEDVTDPLELALKASGCDQATVVHKPRLLSDNGSSYLSGDLAEWLDEQSMEHVRGAPSHPQTQGKIERWHLSVSNSSSGRRWKLDHAPAVGDPTHMVEFGTGRRAFAREA